MDIFIQWLIANSLKAAVLIIAIFLVQFIFSKQIPPKWKYLMWLLVAVRLVMPSLLELDSSIFNLKNIWQTENINSVALSNQATVIETSSQQTVPTDISVTENGIELSTVVFSVWAAIAFILFLYLIWKNLSLLALVRKERTVIESKWLKLLENCKRELKLYTPIQLIETRHVSTPALMGFIRPRILLPEKLLNTLTESEMKLIFMHELTHLKRGDIIINWIISLIQVIHWFNPFVWIAFAKSRETRELACDDSTLSSLKKDDSKRYGLTIIKLLDLCYNENSITGMVGILENKKQIKRRIKMIKNYKRSTKKTVIFALILLSVMGTVFLSEAKENDRLALSKKLIDKILPLKQGALVAAGCNSSESIKKYFEDRGAKFPVGAKIIYSRRKSHLIITNTRDNLNRIEIIIQNELSKAQPPANETVLKGDKVILKKGKSVLTAGKITLKKAQPSASSEKSGNIQQKLNSIIIPNLNIESAAVKTAVQFLNRLGKRYDPNGVGVNIILMASDNDSKKTVDLVMAKRSLYDAIYFLCKASGLKFRIEKDAVIIFSESSKKNNYKILKYGDGKADGMKSYGGNGEMIKFSLSTENGKIQGIKIHGSRYGLPKPPEEDFEIYILNENLSNTLYTLKAPYKTFKGKRAENKWVEIKFAKAIEVPKTFWIVLNFNAHRTKGIYISYDTSTKGIYSKIGLPAKGVNPKAVSFGGDWMIQVLEVVK